jgi:hypothetical protein
MGAAGTDGSASGSVAVSDMIIAGVSKPNYTCVLEGSNHSYFAALKLVTISCFNGKKGLDIIQVNAQFTNPMVGDIVGPQVSAQAGTMALAHTTSATRAVKVTSWSESDAHLVGTAEATWTSPSASSFKMAFDLFLKKQ